MVGESQASLRASMAGKENPSLSGMLTTDFPWHNVVAQLLSISQIMTWGNIPMEKNSLTSAITQAFQRHRTDDACRDRGWLLLRELEPFRGIMRNREQSTSR